MLLEPWHFCTFRTSLLSRRMANWGLSFSLLYHNSVTYHRPNTHFAPVIVLGCGDLLKGVLSWWMTFKLQEQIEWWGLLERGMPQLTWNTYFQWTREWRTMKIQERETRLRQKSTSTLHPIKCLSPWESFPKDVSFIKERADSGLYWIFSFEPKQMFHLNTSNMSKEWILTSIDSTMNFAYKAGCPGLQEQWDRYILLFWKLRTPCWWQLKRCILLKFDYRPFQGKEKPAT